jgi:CheY-like chemotaxis protein/glycosyltransferase involved in cell wall biosynthesis
MKILMVNTTLDSYAGSETFTYTLACELKRVGHDVICFSPRLGRLADRLRESYVTVTADLAEVPDDIDVIHAHHRHESLLAFSRFPNKPMILVCHGILPWQERPFRSRLNIHRYVAVSEEVRDHLVRRHRVHPRDVLVVRNGIDLRRFAARLPIRARPMHALILSNYMPAATRDLIANVCGQLGISLREVGKAQSRWDVEEEINRADLVFALGRGALEALACKRAVIVFDYNGADGLVTPENFHLLRLRNLSGRTHRHQYTEESLRGEIERYDPSTADPLYEVVRREHDVRHMAARYVALYEEATTLPEWKRARPEELAVRHYRGAAELFEDTNGLRTLVAARDQTIQMIYDSRGWRVLEALRRVRRRVRGVFSRTSPPPRRARVLVVDDDPLLTGWLVDVLAADGHEVDAAHDGHGALRRLESSAYDLILSDLRMPRMDGVELYRRLERDRPEVARQVVFLSGHRDNAEYAGFLSELRDRSLAKPVHLEDLQRRVREVLSVDVQ